MTTAQIILLDECRDTGRARADERLTGNRYVIIRDKDKNKPRRGNRPRPAQEAV